MKKITLFMIALLATLALTACGGGSTSASNNYPNPVVTDNANPPVYPANPKTPSGKLIIDNGRGTMNNQDTEQLK